MSVSFDPTRLKREEKALGVAPAAPDGALPGGVDPIVLAFFYLLEAANTSAQTASIHAKEMSQNAQAQQQLNREAASLKWFSLPKPEYNNHTAWTNHKTRVHKTIHGWTANWGRTFTWRGTITTWVTVKHTWKTIQNSGDIQNAQSNNQQIAADRQILSQRIAGLQNTAHIKETNINTTIDTSMQDIQEGQNLLQILEALTFKALMRQPPQ